MGPMSMSRIDDLAVALAAREIADFIEDHPDRIGRVSQACAERVVAAILDEFQLIPRRP